MGVACALGWARSQGGALWQQIAESHNDFGERANDRLRCHSTSNNDAARRKVVAAGADRAYA